MEIVTSETITKELMQEAVSKASRLERNFANRDGTVAVPMVARDVLLLSMTIIKMNNIISAMELREKEAPVPISKDPAAPKVKKTYRRTKKKKDVTKDGKTDKNPA